MFCFKDYFFLFYEWKACSGGSTLTLLLLQILIYGFSLYSFCRTIYAHQWWKSWHSVQVWNGHTQFPNYTFILCSLCLVHVNLYFIHSPFMKLLQIHNTSVSVLQMKHLRYQSSTTKLWAGETSNNNNTLWFFHVSDINTIWLGNYFRISETFCMGPIKQIWTDLRKLWFLVYECHDVQLFDSNEIKCILVVNKLNVLPVDAFKIVFLLFQFKYMLYKELL